MTRSERVRLGRLKHVLLAVTLVAFPRGAFAGPELQSHVLPQALRLHLVSWHDRGEFHNANLGAALRWNRGLILGGFQNSFGRPSWYGGLALPAFERRALKIELMAGVISGYSETRPLDVVAVPSLGWRISPRNSVQVVFMPRLVIPANAVHVMFERHLGGDAAR